MQHMNTSQYVKQTFYLEGAQARQNSGECGGLWGEALFWLDFFVYFLHLRKKVKAQRLE